MKHKMSILKCLSKYTGFHINECKDINDILRFKRVFVVTDIAFNELGTKESVRCILVLSLTELVVNGTQ